MSYTDSAGSTRMPVTIGNGGVTAANAEVTATFDAPVRHYSFQNNSTQSIMFETDSTSSAGSQQIYPGGQTQFFDEECRVLHIWCGTAGIPINGTTPTGIVVRGRQ